MQSVMDEYAGGISKDYRYNSNNLKIAEKKIHGLMTRAYKLSATDSHNLLFIYELLDRLYVAKVLIKHMQARKETRWHCYEEFEDYPQVDDKNYLKYINSVYKSGQVKIITRDLVGRDEVYEHKN